MALRWIVRYILSNERVLQKLSNSFAVRIAAQITAYWMHKGKEIGRKKIKNIKKSIAASQEKKSVESSTSKALTPAVKQAHVFKTFLESFEEQWKQEEIKRNLKKEAKKKQKTDL